MWQLKRQVTFACLLTFVSLALLATYVFSVMWRVSLAEHEVLGRSLLIKAFKNEPRFVDSPVLRSYGSSTYRLNCDGIKITVWPEKINGYQHTLGSAIASYELGECLADKLFAANEWFEWLVDKNGVSRDDILDRRRDLANNRVGRRIGAEARVLNLSGADAETYMRIKVLSMLEFSDSIIEHPYEPRALALSEAELGCPYLPDQNLFDVSQKVRSRYTRTKRRLMRRAHQIFMQRYPFGTISTRIPSTHFLSSSV